MRSKVAAKSWRGLMAAGAISCLGALGGWQAPALAGSDNSSDTYAGDYQGGSLPPGTFIVLQYAGIQHGDVFVDPRGHEVPNSHGTVLEEFTRFTYFSRLFGHPFVIEGEIPYATLTDVNIPVAPNNRVAHGFTDPVIHLTYYFVSDAHAQRWLGFTNYFYLPIGRRFDNTAGVNVSTPRQFTDVAQIGYTEGLGKFVPGLKGFFFDFVGNVSFHTDGDSPLAVAPGVQFDKLSQDNSYNVKAFLRYDYTQLGFVAAGIEKSWGGDQIASGGVLGALEGPTTLSKDEWLRGHLQFQVPLAPDFAVAADIAHDFEREGGLKNDIIAEIRLAKFFLPQAPMK